MIDWECSIRAAIKTLERSLCLDGYYLGRKSSVRSIEGARLMLPYVLHPMQGNTTHWIWVNREYKPIGTFEQWAKYEEYIHLHVSHDDNSIKSLLAKCKAFAPYRKESGFVLFNDITTPWLNMRNAKAYYDILKLISLNNKEDES